MDTAFICISFVCVMYGLFITAIAIKVADLLDNIHKRDNRKR